MAKEERCRICNSPVKHGIRTPHWFCSEECKSKYNSLSIPDWCGEVCSSTVGAVNELIASIDLMKRGYEVYRNMAPTGKNDLVAFKNGVFIGIDVKTGRRRVGDGKIVGPKKAASSYIAVVVDSEEVIYLPELPVDA